MTVQYCTPEWLEVSQAKAQAEPRIVNALSKLSIKVCFRVKADPKWGLDKDVLFGSFLENGELKRLSLLTEEEAKQQADYILAATPQEWKKILRKQAKFVADFMLGKITLEQGSKVGILGVAPYSGTLVDALTLEPLQFQDEMTPEELAQFRARMQQTHA